MSRDTTATRRRIIEAADELFYSEGVKSVSVDRIAGKAAITKRTLYYHFRSKDDLIAAYLAERDVPTMQRYRTWLGMAPGPVLVRLERMFGELAKAAADPKWRGCGFLRVAVELANLPGHPARRVAAAHKRRFEAWLADELRAEGILDPAGKARCLMIVLDGVIAEMIIHKNNGYAGAAISMCRAVLGMSPCERPATISDADVDLQPGSSSTKLPRAKDVSLAQKQPTDHALTTAGPVAVNGERRCSACHHDVVVVPGMSLRPCPSCERSAAA